MGRLRPVADLRRWLVRERSPWALSGFVALFSISVAMLVLGWSASDRWSQLLLNLGSDLVVLSFGAVFFEPLVEQARRGQVTDRKVFDHRWFCARVGGARHCVTFLGTWTGLLGEENRALFLAELGAALDRGVRVRLLLLHPDSAAAAQRAEDLKNLGADARDLIRENLHVLHGFHRGRTGRVPEVRVYNASVSESLYQLDERAIVGKLPLDRLGSDSRQSEAGIHHPLMVGLLARFEELWAHAETIGLEEYMEVEARVHVFGSDPFVPRSERSVRLRYVVDADRSWHVVACGGPAIPRPGTGTMTATVTRPGERPDTFALVPVSGREDALREAFARKYGSVEDVVRVHRLIRDDDPVGPPRMATG